MLGAIGNNSIDDVIMFEVSENKLLNFSNFVRSNSVRFSKNDVLLKKPISQYIGPELDVISLDIVLKAQFGVDPKEEINKLVYLQRDGETISILVGTTLFGMFRWVIKSLNFQYTQIDNKGNCIEAKVSLSLEEYI